MSGENWRDWKALKHQASFACCCLPLLAFDSKTKHLEAKASLGPLKHEFAYFCLFLLAKPSIWKQTQAWGILKNKPKQAWGILKHMPAYIICTCLLIYLFIYFK